MPFPRVERSPTHAGLWDLGARSRHSSSRRPTALGPLRPFPLPPSRPPPPTGASFRSASHSPHYPPSMGCGTTRRSKGSTPGKFPPACAAGLRACDFSLDAATRYLSSRRPGGRLQSPLTVSKFPGPGRKREFPRRRQIDFPFRTLRKRLRMG